MAEPGTNTLNLHDATGKHRVEYRSVTTQPGGVVVISALSRIVHAQATWAEYIGTEPNVLQVVISSDATTATVYATGRDPKVVDLMLIGNP